MNIDGENPIYHKTARERFDENPSTIQDYELLELILKYVSKNKDVKTVSKDLLSTANGINNLLAPNMLGSTSETADLQLFFTLLREILCRSTYQRLHNTVISQDNLESVYKFLKFKIGCEPKENFIILLLDNKRKLKGYKVIREGQVNAVSISPRDVIEAAMQHKSINAVIIAHNHPSGDATPSAPDYEITKKIVHAAESSGITLSDHIVVTYTEYYSMSENGDLKSMADELKS